MTNLAMIYCKAPFDPELSSGTVDPTFWGDCKILCYNFGLAGSDLRRVFFCVKFIKRLTEIIKFVTLPEHATTVYN